MGMQDRNCYHREPFRPPRQDEWRPFRRLATTAIAVLLVLVIVREFAEDRSLAKFLRLAIRLHEAPTAQVVERTIYRCIWDGQVVSVGPEDCSSRVPERQRPSAPPPAFVPPVQRAPALTEYRREMLRSADARIARDEANARAEMMSIRQRAAESCNVGTCAALDQEIASLDAWARRPLSGAEQDHIRARRQQVRCKQSELRC